MYINIRKEEICGRNSGYRAEGKTWDTTGLITLPTLSNVVSMRSSPMERQRWDKFYIVLRSRQNWKKMWIEHSTGA
jgi:hypothetical protein